jgi:hypothetical protein
MALMPLSAAATKTWPSELSPKVKRMELSVMLIPSDLHFWLQCAIGPFRPHSGSCATID